MSQALEQSRLWASGAVEADSAGSGDEAIVAYNSAIRLSRTLTLSLATSTRACTLAHTGLRSYQQQPNLLSLSLIPPPSPSPSLS